MILKWDPCGLPYRFLKHSKANPDFGKSLVTMPFPGGTGLARPWRVRGASVARPLSGQGYLAKATEGVPSWKSLCSL